MSHPQASPHSQRTTTARHFANAPTLRTNSPNNGNRAPSCQWNSHGHSTPTTTNSITKHSVGNPLLNGRTNASPQTHSETVQTYQSTNPFDHETPPPRFFDRYKVFRPVCFRQFPPQMHVYFLYLRHDPTIPIALPSTLTDRHPLRMPT